VAVIFAEVELDTWVVETVKVPVVAPAETSTLLGTVADVELLLRRTLTPPVGACPASVIVPVEVDPPETLLGFNVKLPSDAALIVTDPLTDEPAALQVTVAVFVAVTEGAILLKPACWAPPGMVKDAGTENPARLLLSVTVNPPLGAGEPIWTLATVVFPPSTVLGVKVIDRSFGASIVRVALAELAPNLPLITAEVFAAPGVVETGNVAVVKPALTVTVPGTDAAEFDELSVTAIPPVGAFADKVTLPVEVFPP